MSVDNSPPKYDVVGVGSLSVDEIMTVDDVMRMETIDRNGADKKYIAIEYSSKLNVKSFKTFPGGSAPNVLCDLSNVGFKTALLGAVGDDVGGDISLSDLKKHRVEFSAVKTVKGESTAHSVILITPWGRYACWEYI
jgi:sugar/nucleoside kinase (ribokinase family)